MSRRTLGARLNLTDSAVAAWESGRNIPDPKTLESIERILGTGGLLQDIVECMVTDEKSQEYMGRWAHVESQATTLLWFEMRIVPGLLQTEDYARAILRDDQRVSARLDRQKTLAREDPPVVVALIDESVLRRNVGGPAVMRDQLDHLENATQQENVILHVLRMTAPICAQYTGPFILASYNGATEIGYMDDAISGGVVENADEIARLRRMFEIFRGYALNQEESVRLVREVARSWT
jgi:transcriptional regulator with XRE-family HTH domain